jgi:DNA-directed RNA polymerase specialized sigma24 family protein
MTLTDGQVPSLDPAATFYQFIWPRAEMILRLAMMANPDRAAAEELAYQTLTAAAQSPADRGEMDWQTWILRILYRKWKQRLTAGAASETTERRYQHEPPRGAEIIAADPGAVLAGLTDEQILLAVRGLPEPFRWMVLLLDVAGIVPPHVAVILDTPIWTIQTQMREAHAMLRDLVVPLAAEVEEARKNQVFERR